MTDFALAGSELKRHIKIARTQPLAFAYNPGGPKDEDYFALHRKRTASQLGKSAKTDGPGSKAAFGEARVDGRVLELQCEVLVSSIARKLKQHLKKNKVNLNIRVLDADGTVVEEDIEDLEDDPELDDGPEPGEPVAEDPAASDPDVPEAPPEPAEAQAAEALQDASAKDDPADIVAGLKRIQPAVISAPDPTRAKLKEVMARIVGLIKAGEISTARATFEKLDAAVAKLAGSQPASAQPEAAPEPPAPPPPPPAPDATDDTLPDDYDDARLRALSEMAKATKVDIAAAAVPDDTREKLSKALQVAIGALNERDLDQAETILDRLAEALTRLGMASDPIRDSKAKKDKLKKKKAEQEKKAQDRVADQTGTPPAPEEPAPASDAGTGPDGDDSGEFDQRAYDLLDKLETLRGKMITQFGLEVQ
ncbi:unnamed protein product, partial [Ectocarpus sp. 12 AP-2014]